MKKEFDAIYEQDLWKQGQGTGSGEGSHPDSTKEYRTFLQDFIKNNNIKSVLDLGCGDWQFSRLLNWDDVDYIGFDVARAVIEENKKKYGSDTVKFYNRDIASAKLPITDLIIIKDVMQHWPNMKILNFLPKLLKFNYALIINCSYLNEHLNRDIRIGEFRPLDIRIPPFSISAKEVFSFHTDYSSIDPSVKHKKVLLLNKVEASKNQPNKINKLHKAIAIFKNHGPLELAQFFYRYLQQKIRQ